MFNHFCVKSCLTILICLTLVFSKAIDLIMYFCIRTVKKLINFVKTITSVLPTTTFIYSNVSVYFKAFYSLLFGWSYPIINKHSRERMEVTEVHPYYRWNNCKWHFTIISSKCFHLLSGKKKWIVRIQLFVSNLV